MRMHPRGAVAVALATVAATAAAITLASAKPAARRAPITPIEHVVVIFDENETFDHYFATYPDAENQPGEVPFAAGPGTPAVNSLKTPVPVPATPSGTLLAPDNPNSQQPNRLSPAQGVTCDQGHGYSQLQAAANGGLMDRFPEHTAGCEPKSIVMAYYDGNTVGALWRYAQGFAMSDNHFAATYGPSTPGALNLVSGQTHGVSPASAGTNGTMIGDPDPVDDCGSGNAVMSGQNIGDLMNAQGVTWGWFQGGFRPTRFDKGASRATCAAAHKNVAGGGPSDYSAHHQPFQYYASTRNVHHLPPTSVDKIGQTDQANHQYDLDDFDKALAAGNLPQVSFLKAAAFEDGHPGYSGPVDEMRWVARAVNAIQNSPYWANTAIFITYDDADGWYDHVFKAPTNPSRSSSDVLNGAGQCGVGAPTDGYQNRCGPGQRLPLVVVSPWAKRNYVSHDFITQVSVTRFIEDNWSLGKIGDGSFDATAPALDDLFAFGGAGDTPKVFIDPATGAATGARSDPTAPAPVITTEVIEAPATTTTTGATPAPAPTPTPTPTVKPVIKRATLTVSARRSGKKVVLSLRFKNLPSSAKGTATVKLTRAARTVASGRGTVKAGRLRITLRSRRTVRKGSYRLSVSLKQGAKLTRLSTALKLK